MSGGPDFRQVVRLKSGSVAANLVGGPGTVPSNRIPTLPSISGSLNVSTKTFGTLSAQRTTIGTTPLSNFPGTLSITTKTSGSLPINTRVTGSLAASRVPRNVFLGSIGLGTGAGGLQVRLTIVPAGATAIIINNRAGSPTQLTQLWRGGVLIGALGFGNAGAILTGAGSQSIALRATNKLHFAGGGDALGMTVDTTQKIGIGTTGPQQPLHVVGAGQFGTIMGRSNAGSLNRGTLGSQKRIQSVLGSWKFPSAGLRIGTVNSNATPTDTPPGGDIRFGSTYLFVRKISGAWGSLRIG